MSIGKELLITDNEPIIKDELFQQAFTFSGIGMALLSINGSFFKVNHSLCNILGYTEQELLETSFQVLTHPDDLNRNLEQAQQLINGDISCMKAEKRYLHKQGHYIWCRLISSVVRFENGTAEFYVSQIEDITEQKRAQELLVERNKMNTRLNRMQQVFEYATDGLFFTDVLDDGRFNIVEINPAFTAMSGVTEEYINLPFDERQDNGDGSICFIMSKYHEVVLKKEVVEYEISYNDHVAQTRLIPILNENGNVVHVIGMLTDITNKKMYEEQQFKREQEFRSLVENSPDVIIRYDCDCRRTYVNPAYLKEAGLTLSEAIGTKLEQLTPLSASATQLLQNLIKQVIDSSMPGEIDMEWTNAQDVYRCFSLRAVPEFGKDGKVETVMTIARDITERREAETLLARREREFCLLAENSPEPIFRYNHECQLVYVNKAVERISGIPISKLLGKTPTEAMFVSMPDSIKVQLSVKKVLETGISDKVEATFTPSDGRKRYYHNLHVPEFAEDGTVESVLSITSDITERKQYELSLLERIEMEQRQSHLFANAPGFFYTLQRGSNGNFTMPFASIGIIDVLSLQPEEVVENLFLLESLIPAEDIEIFIGETEKSERNFTACHFEYRIEHQRKGLRWIEVRSMPQHDQDGRVHWHGFMHDVTERVLNENKLRESEEQYRIIAENTADIITVFDLNFKPIYVSPSVQKILGFTVQEAMARSADQILTQASLQIAQKVLAYQLALEIDKDTDPSRTTVLVLEEYCKDGSTIWVEISATFIRDKNSKPIGFIGVTRDITERKRWEEVMDISESKYRTVFESSNDGIFMHQIVECNGNVEFILHDVNQKGFEMMGNSYENIILGDFDLLTAGDPPYTLEEAMRRNQLAAAGHPQLFDWPLKRKDGSEIWGEINLHCTRIGNNDYLLAVVRDITERKRLEEVNLHLSADLSATLQAIPDFLFEVDIKGTYLNIWAKESSHLAQQKDLLLGLTIFDVLPLQAAQIAYSSIEEAAQKGSSYGKIYNIDQPEGTRWFELSVSKKTSIGNFEERFIAIARDITERKQMEKALRESEQKVQRKLNSILSPEISLETLELSDIIDSTKITVLLERFNKLTNIAIGIIDCKGKMLVEAGWQDICNKFHRSHPETCRLCSESEMELCSYIPAGSFKEHKCKNNMWDIATPIMVGGKHMGNLLLTQFVYDDEILDIEIFKQQALRYGFNEQEYIEAFNKIPRLSRESIDAAISFHAVLADLISTLSYSNIKLANALEMRKQMEAQIRQQNDFQQLLLNALRDIGQIILVVEDGKVIYNNDFHQGCQLGYAKGEMEENPNFIGWAHPDDRALLMDNYKRRINGEPVPNCYEIGAITKTGERREYELFGSVIPNTNPIQVAILKRDITHRKIVEQELIKAKEKAEESDRLKSAFLATMNHELRTPLNHIIGFCELIKWKPEEAKEYANTILTSGKHLLNMFEDIFMLSIAEQSKLIIRNQPIDLGNMFSDSCEVLTEILRNSGKADNIVLEFNPNIPVLSNNENADLNKIKQVLSNLFKNAVKFTNKGRIEFGLTSEKPGWLTFYVSDTGIGIPADKQHVVFEFFRQADDSHSRKFEGIGIGLAISKRIVEVLNGALTFVSEPGIGTTFYFSLPLESGILKDSILKSLK